MDNIEISLMILQTQSNHTRRTSRLPRKGWQDSRWNPLSYVTPEFPKTRGICNRLIISLKPLKHSLRIVLKFPSTEEVVENATTMLLLCVGIWVMREKLWIWDQVWRMQVLKLKYKAVCQPSRVSEGFGRLLAFLVQAKEDLSRNLSTTTQENN